MTEGGRGEESKAVPDDDGIGRLDEDEKLAMLSKVMKSGSVETFDWEYKDRKFINGRQSDQVTTKKVENIQAILINPRWAEHGFDTFASATTTTQDSVDDVN